MPRTFRTLSLSLPPQAVDALAEAGRAMGKTSARIAAELVLGALGMDRDGNEARGQDEADPSRILDAERVGAARAALDKLTAGIKGRMTAPDDERLQILRLAEATSMQLALLLSTRPT